MVGQKRLRILLITSGFTPIVEPLFDSQHDIVGVAQSRARKPKGRLARFKRRVVDQLLACRATVTSTPSLAQYARRQKCPYVFMKHGCDAAFQDWLGSLCPDIIVVYSMGELLPAAVFDAPPMGTINVHPSLLPAYRGPDPILWQYLCFDRRHGATVHYIDAGEDTGDVLAQKTVEIPVGHPISLTTQSVLEAGVEALMTVLDDLARNGVKPKPQPAQSPTDRARRVKRSKVEQQIEWSALTVEQAWHLLAGLGDRYHLLGGFEEGGGIHSYIVESRSEEIVSSQAPGVLLRRGEDVSLICRDGMIRMRRIISLRMLIRRWLV